MNELDARAIPHQGQFVGQFRKVHKAEYETVCENGEPILFKTSDAAKVAAWEALAASGHLSTLMRRDGCTLADTARAAAERLFARHHGEDEACEKRAGSGR